MTLSLRALAALVSALAAGPALAQVIPTGRPAADILLAQAISDQRVFLTCSSLDGRAHPVILDFWQKDVADAVAILTENDVGAEAIAAFTTAAAPENLLPAPETPFADVQQLCGAQPDWQTNFSRAKFTILRIRLPKAFE